MGLQYDGYLDTHRMCVLYGFNWIVNNFSIEEMVELLPSIRYEKLMKQIAMHDESKDSEKEYDAYDRYFYSERTPEIEKDFDYAWLHHLHNNKHHWQYWILKEDDSYVDRNNNSIIVKALDMPDRYILEMICDWWSFSWSKYLKSHNKNDLYEVFNWYSDHADKILLSSSTETKVENMLNAIKEKLDSSIDTIQLYSEAFQNEVRLV